MKGKIIRPLLGILLIIFSILALIWWENTGRKELTMESVMVAKEDIQRGHIIKEGDFTETKTSEDMLVAGALVPENFSMVKGYVVNQYVPKGAQVTEKMFNKRDSILDKENSIFPIKETWIDSRSSSLRKGDIVDIFDEKGILHVGTFNIAYVKDSEEQEVIGTEQNVSEEILQRNFSSSVIAHVEIISTLADYEKIWDLAEVQGVKFLLVQRGKDENE